MGSTWQSLLRELDNFRSHNGHLNQEAPTVMRARLDNLEYLLQTVLEKLRDANPER